MTEGSLTDVAHWQSVWREMGDEPLARPDFNYDGVLARFLPRGEEKDALEVGCYPGTYMAYLGQRFGYRVSGIDFMPGLSRLREPLERAGVRVADLFEGDFFTVEPGRTFDLVGSFGFVEHFENLEENLERHARLVSPGGLLVVTLPYFRGLQYWLRRWLEPHQLETHCVEAMRLSRYQAFLNRTGLEPLYCDYYRTFDFWLSPNCPRLGKDGGFALRHRVAMRGSWVAKGALRAARLDNIPNRWTSPFVVVIARRS